MRIDEALIQYIQNYFPLIQDALSNAKKGKKSLIKFFERVFKSAKNTFSHDYSKKDEN